MKATIVGAALASLLAQATAASACVCGVPGLDSALTSREDTWGARLAQNVMVGHGRWNAHGDYRPLAADEREHRYELEALAALRLLRRWELSASTSYLRVSANAPATGPGDAFARARFDAIDEAPAHSDGAPWPALAVTASLRLPTASTTAGALGLGAYEAGLGANVERTIQGRVRIGASGSMALRTPDESLGARRHLGPRATGQVIGWYWPTPNLALSAASSIAWEGDVTFAGARQVGSGSRQWQVGAGAALRPAGSRLRSSLRVRCVPPLSAVNVNTLGDTGVEVSLAYAR